MVPPASPSRFGVERNAATNTINENLIFDDGRVAFARCPVANPFEIFSSNLH